MATPLSHSSSFHRFHSLSSFPTSSSPSSSSSTSPVIHCSLPSFVASFIPGDPVPCERCAGNGLHSLNISDTDCLRFVFKTEST
ncbi:hypothetical protein RHMOL_Rhmol01G0272000 [Rhododendron molle]|uniref:Uncharacterized protein n=1 Tax=Rhododendron molle TaxID=49168 RepID=A0ACC0Q973_RHOML|nr:hypothetical protein RHMOL_Rhmol01G0272000 [Rhododendron molle]